MYHGRHEGKARVSEGDGVRSYFDVVACAILAMIAAVVAPALIVDAVGLLAWAALVVFGPRG